MNNTYVITRLNQWALWCAIREDSGLGYPKSVPYTNLMPRTGFSSNAPEISEDCQDVEKCVQALKVVNNDLFIVIMLTYRRMMTNDQRYKEAGCCKQTFYTHLGRAHQMVLGYLNDLAAGVALPTADVRKVM